MAHLATHDDLSGAKEVELAARRRTYPLTEFQRSMLEVQLCQPNACVVNLPLVCSMPREAIDVERLVQAMRQAVDHHPVFRTILEFDGQGCIVQRYDASLPYEIPVAEVTDEEFDALRGSLNRPMRLLGASLVDLRLYVAQTNVHLVLVAHHAAVEGTTLNVLLESVVRGYEGNAELAPDAIFSFLDEASKKAETAAYAEARAYFEREYGQTKWCTNLKPDYASNDLSSANFMLPTSVTSKVLRRVRERLGISPNEFSALAALMALAEVEGEPNVRLDWVYQNRANPTYHDAAGMLISLLPFGATVGDDLSKMAAQVHDRSRAARPHSSYEWCLAHEKLYESDALFLVYEGSILQLDVMKRLHAQRRTLPSPTHTVMRRTSLQVSLFEQGMLFKFIYARNLYDESHILAFKDALMRSIDRLVQF